MVTVLHQKHTKLAFTMPGKIGDALYALPMMKEICELKGCESDFYTSDYCEPLRNLFEYQSYIDKFIVPREYKIERMDMGIQPWKMPVNLSKYETTYHLGFRYVPDKPLHLFMAHSLGFNLTYGISYQYPEVETLNEPYLVLAPRGETSYKNLFLDFIDVYSYKVVVIGGKGDYIGKGIDKTGLDFLDTLSWIANSLGFVGIMSSQLVLANGFNIPKIAVHDGKSWDMRHIVRSETNFYPVNPTAVDILKLL